MQNPTIDLVKYFFKDEKNTETFNNYIFKSEYLKNMDLGIINNE